MGLLIVYVKDFSWQKETTYCFNERHSNTGGRRSHLWIIRNHDTRLVSIIPMYIIFYVRDLDSWNVSLILLFHINICVICHKRSNVIIHSSFSMVVSYDCVSFLSGCSHRPVLSKSSSRYSTHNLFSWTTIRVFCVLFDEGRQTLECDMVYNEYRYDQFTICLRHSFHVSWFLPKLFVDCIVP